MRIGPWELSGEIARGGGGAVFRARSIGGGPEAALKLVHLGGAGQEARLTRFRREAEALRRLSHPGIVRVLDAGEHQGQPWLALELVEGVSLAERLERDGALPLAEVVELGLAIAGALAHAHARGVVHRDVKPGNVLLSRAGVPRLTDFGLALQLDPERTRLSQSGQIMGTPGYMAPEQVLGRVDAIGPPADVYGLGATLYALLTGGPPFAGEGIAELLVATTERTPVRPGELRPEVDRDLERLVLACLEKQPAARPSAAEVEQALARRLQPRLSPAPRTSGWRPALAAAGALGLLVLAAALLVPRGAPGPTPSPVAPTPTPSAPAPEAPAVDPAERARAEAAEAAFMATVGGEQGPPRPGELLDGAEAALARDPDQAGPWLVRASAYSVTGRYHEGIEAARRATELAPAWARAWCTLGSLLALSVPGRGAEGLSCLDRAVALAPDDPEALRLRGWAYATQGRLESARADLDLAVELAPKLAHAWHLRGWVALRQDDLTAAVASLARAVELGAGPESQELLEQARRAQAR